jgi:hypothetical protein
MHKSAPAEFSVALGKTSSDDHSRRSTEPRWLLRCVGTDLMQRSAFAKEPDQLPLLVRIEAHLPAMIRDIKVSGTWLADLSVVDMFHQRFLLGGKRRNMAYGSDQGLQRSGDGQNIFVGIALADDLQSDRQTLVRKSDR